MTEAARDTGTVLRLPRERPGALATATAALRRLVERSTSAGNAAAAGGAGRDPAPNAGAVEAYRRELEAAALDDPAGWAPLARFTSTLGLSRFERDLLLLCAAVELDPALLAALPGTAAGHPTFALALLLLGEGPAPSAAAPAAAWAALSPGAPLHRYRLVSSEPGDFLLRAPLRIDDVVFAYLLGAAASDPRMRDLVEPVAAPAYLPPTHEAVARRMAALWGARAAGAPPAVIELASEDAAAPRAIAARACAALGLSLVMIRAADVPAAGGDRAGLARLWEREHAMSGTALLIDVTDESPEKDGGKDGSRAALELAEVIAAPLVLATREPVSLRRASTVRLDVARPEIHEQIEVWRHALPAGTSCPDDVLEPLAAQFRGGSTTAEAVAATLLGTLPAGATPAEVARALHDACRTASRRRLDSLAARISARVTWDDLVVPPHTAKALREITAQLRHRVRVYDGWGFGERGDRGLGISALFHGDSGTGKTLAAEVIASELGLDLYRVDLSRVVSKYIGETEKNLRRVFDAAEEGGAILLFDEADALFGKRSEVNDSHDRYANVEVSYLLSRMETYRGLAILTTNFRQALDQAFLRRIRFIVQFPFPDAAQRAAIWARAFPSRTPTEGLNPALLARLAITGGSIRNIAIGAAFLAAEANQPVTPAHLLQAAAAEYGKLNKSLTDAETRGWT